MARLGARCATIRSARRPAAPRRHARHWRSPCDRPRGCARRHRPPPDRRDGWPRCVREFALSRLRWRASWRAGPCRRENAGSGDQLTSALGSACCAAGPGQGRARLAGRARSPPGPTAAPPAPGRSQRSRIPTRASRASAPLGNDRLVQHEALGRHAVRLEQRRGAPPARGSLPARHSSRRRRWRRGIPRSHDPVDCARAASATLRGCRTPRPAAQRSRARKTHGRRFAGQHGCDRRTGAAGRLRRRARAGVGGEPEHAAQHQGHEAGQHHQCIVLAASL